MTYVAPAVHFSPGAILKNAALIATDNSYWASSGWYRSNPAGEDADPVVYSIDPEDTYTTSLFFIQTVQSVFSNIAISVPASVQANVFPEVGQWFHILLASDFSVGGAFVGKIYINDVDVTGFVTDGPDPLEYLSNGLPFWVGWDGLFAKFDGDMSDIWVAPGTNLLVDGDIPLATRRKFITADGRPVDPAAFPPSSVLLSGDASTFHLNLGYGGTFAPSGPALTNSVLGPSREGSTMGFPNNQGDPNGAIPVWMAGTPPANMANLGYEQVTSLVTAQPLPILPAAAKVAVISPETGNVRWRSDGVDPTASVGNILYATAQLTVSGAALATIRFINYGGTAKLNVQYYG